MKWVRQIFVYLLSIVLFFSLVSIAFATSIQTGLTHQNKIENWLSQSNLYSSLETTIADQAQSAIQNNVPAGITVSQTAAQQATQAVFPQASLQQSVQTIVNSNYAWLEGKTATPNFTIDLSRAKSRLAIKIADLSLVAHFNALPQCSVSQTLQLQNADPLLLSCRPAGISSQAVATQVGEQFASSSDFLSDPIITATTLNVKQFNGTPYYTKLSKLPRAYQITQKLPWISSIVAVLCIVGIFFLSRTKRLGMRRISIVLLLSGVVLVADKLITDALYTKYKGRLFSSISSKQIQQSLTSFVHYIETELTKIDLWFGVVYLVLAVILLGILIATRRRPLKSKAETSPRLDDNTRAVPSASDAHSANLTKKPSLDIVGSTIKSTDSTTKIDRQNLRQHPKQHPRTRPPRLIQ